MSILNDAVKQLKDVTGWDAGFDADNVVFHSQRLIELLESSKPIKRDDKDLLVKAMNIFANLAEN